MARFGYLDRATAGWLDRSTAGWLDAGTTDLVEGYCDLPYQMVTSAVEGYCDVLWGICIEGRFDLLYSDAPGVYGHVNLPYGDAPGLYGYVDLPYGNAPGLYGYVDLPYCDAVEGYCDLPYSISAGELEGYCDLPAPLYDYHLVEGYCDLPYPVLDGSSIMDGAEITVTAGGVTIDYLALAMDLSLDQYVISCSIDLPGPDEYARCPHGAELVVTVDGTAYPVVVEGTEISVRHGGKTWRITCLSPGSRLDAPYAVPVTRKWEAAALASAIAQDIAEATTVNWTLVDWVIPANTFFQNGETPLAALRKLAAVVGGVVQENADGSVSCVPEYAISPPYWATAAVSATLTAADDIEVIDARYEVRGGENKYTVSDHQAGSEQIRLEPVGADPARRVVRGYRAPWDAGFGLSHTGGAWVGITDQGTATEDITETVEIVGGAGRVSKPVYAVTATVWLAAQLGAVTWSEDGALTSEVAGESLLEITYTTRYRQWTVADARTEQVQFVAEEA